MGIWGRNPNEVNYAGGKKHWTDVIKNTGAGDLLIWRQPEEDFNTNSTLIVMPGEEAIFIKNGVIEQVFGEGTYKLTTNNYPFISRLRNAFSGGVSTFNCVIYFVRKAHSIEILWGTDSPLQVRDKKLKVATNLKARGTYKVQISNPGQFLKKLIGNNIPFQTQKELNKYFYNEFQSKIRTVISRALNETETELLGIGARLDEFSEVLQPYMDDILDDYGLKCIRFVVSAIDIEDDELRRKYDEQQITAVQKVQEAQADKEVLDILGDNWIRVQGLGLLKDMANNPGAGGVASVGAGMTMGIAAAPAYASIAHQVFSPITQEVQQSQNPMQFKTTNRFVQQGAAPQDAAKPEDPIFVLGQLKELFGRGLISKEQYDAKVEEVLKRM